VTLDASSHHEVEESGARRRAALVCRRPGVVQEALAPGAVVVQRGVVQARARRQPSGRRGCGIKSAASREVGVWGMGHRLGRQLVVYGPAGGSVEGREVEVAVWKPLAGWSVAWWREQQAVVEDWEPGCSQRRRVEMAVVVPSRRLAQSVPRCGCSAVW
jgi:hypothetical protein